MTAALQSAMPRSFTLEEYNRIEQQAMLEYSPYILRQFSPLAFTKLGFQTHIADECELWKFVDSQHEFRFEGNVRTSLFNRLTEEEYNLFKTLTSKTVAYCKTHGFPPVSGRNALSRALIALRAICALVPRGSTILDVGAGSGYVSAGLVLLGYKVISYDITQSLFLHQESFFRFLFGARYQCCLKPEDKINLATHDLCHLPWWNMVNREYSLPSIDTITINSALNEISRNGLKYVLQRVRMSASGKRKYPFIIMECLGYPVYDNYEEVMLPLFQPVHYNEHMKEKEYVPVVVMNEPNDQGNTVSSSPPRPPLRSRQIYLQKKLPEFKIYVQRKMHAGNLSVRLAYKIYKSLHNLALHIRARRKTPHTPALPILLQSLHYNAFTFSYTYEDLIDYFKDDLPEGLKLTMDEEFGQFAGTRDHL